MILACVQSVQSSITRNDLRRHARVRQCVWRRLKLRCRARRYAHTRDRFNIPEGRISSIHARI